MTPERWHQIKAVLQAALERNPVERNDFLNEACATDPTLRGEVESLIASYERAGGFIDLPAFEVMADSLTAETVEVGSSLGPYQVSERIGAGGMGEVYLAEDTRLGRKVALKVLPAHFTNDKDRVRRFQQEARAASALNHPNILTIYEIGQIGSRHFIATEFIEGGTLRQRLAKAPVKISETLDIVTQVASAICAAHEAGIVHRDIKPENIMLRRDHIVKVLDFGLAKLTERKAITSESPTLLETAQGTVFGTAVYMSPEQARGFAVDARTDIWSLAVVLYEILTGRAPFEGPTSSDVIASILEREPTALLRYSPETPPELEWIVKKGLRKDREERYQTTRELLTDLRGLKRKLEFEEELERSIDPERKSAGVVRDAGQLVTGADHSTARSAELSREPIDSVAILPLANSSEDPNLEYFSDGVTESMINTLSQLPELRVMAWSTVSRYKSKEIDPRTAGKELGVRSVLTGRVVQLAERLVVKTELVDALDGSHLWGESYSCKPSDIFDVQAEISSEISERLLHRLTADEKQQLRKRYTDNVEAYHAYLRGRYFWNKRTVEGLNRSIEYFQQAIDLDPNYAVAYTGLSDAYTKLGDVGTTALPPREAFSKAKIAAVRALEIDGLLAEAHTSLAHVHLHAYQWSMAEREFKRALELNPNYATTHHWYAYYLLMVGRPDEAAKEISRALELDPLSLPINTDLGELLYFRRQYSPAIEQLQKTLEMDPHCFQARVNLARVYLQKEMFDEAIAEFLKTRERFGDSLEALLSLAHAFAVSGKNKEALNLLERVDELAKGKYVSPYEIAVVYTGLNKKDIAFEWLHKAYEEHAEWVIYLTLDPKLDSLRTDPRFAELVSRIGLPLESVPAPALLSEKQESGRAKSVTSLSTGRPLAQSSWSKREVRVLLGVGVSAVIVALGYLLWQGRQGASDAEAFKNITFSQLTDQSGPEFFPSLSPDGKSLVYASRASGNWDIYLQRVGGSNPRNLTSNSPVDDSQPAFSPDGERIAFRSERDSGGIYSMGATGESLIRISDFGYSPSWSPDGTKILVGTEKIPQPSTRPTKSKLWSIDVKSNERRLLSEGDALQPNYSPNQRRITYWSRPHKAGQREQIWTIAVEGGESIAVTDGSTTDLNPIWSPDGKYLYFSSNRSGSFNVWRVAIDEKTGATLAEPEAVTTVGAGTAVLQLAFSSDGRRLAYSAQEEIRNLRKISFDPTTEKVATNATSITEGSRQLWFPDPSPDGEWLACYSMGQQRHVFIMRTDGSDQRDLTDDNYRHYWPRWSPDGKRIAFSSRRTGNYELWIINRDGSGLQQLTSGHQSPGAHYAVWSPDGIRMAYSIHAPRNDSLVFQPGQSWSNQTPEAIVPLDDASISYESWSWSPDGKKLAGVKHLPSGAHSGIGLYDLESKTYDWLTDFGDWPVWLADSRRLLFVSQGKILLFDTTTRKYHPVLTVTDQDVDIGSPGISRDNRVLYFSFVETQADIWLMDLR